MGEHKLAKPTPELSQAEYRAKRKNTKVKAKWVRRWAEGCIGCGKPSGPYSKPLLILFKDRRHESRRTVYTHKECYTASRAALMAEAEQEAPKEAPQEKQHGGSTAGATLSVN